MRRLFLSSAAIVMALTLRAADDPVVFKSDVAMTRVDAQVVDSDGRIVTGLDKADFVLRLDGKVVPIRNFANENLPIDILLLLDVSGSMQPHVQRIARAAQDALSVLAPHDRIAVMVFDTYTRTRLPFTSDHAEVTKSLDRILRSESFHGGTRITTSLISAADYVQHQARPEARRAIVILTDDETQDSEDEPRVERALTRANAVLSFLQAPYEPPTAGGYPGGGRRRGTWGSGGGWPGGVGWPGGGGGVGLPGGRGPTGGGYDPSHTAGTAEIAADTGGDTMRVDDARSLEDTLSRLRQRYALYFYLPEGAKSAEDRNIQVDLAQYARIRYAQAQIRYRHSSMGNDSVQTATVPTRVTQVPANTTDEDPSTLPTRTTSSGRRAAVNEDSSSRVNLATESDDTATPSSSTSDTPPGASASPQTTAPKKPPQD